MKHTCEQCGALAVVVIRGRFLCAKCCLKSGAALEYIRRALHLPALGGTA